MHSISKFLVVFWIKQFNTSPSSCKSVLLNSSSTSMRLTFQNGKIGNRRKWSSLYWRETKSYITRLTKDWNMCKSLHVYLQLEKTWCHKLGTEKEYRRSWRVQKVMGCMVYGHFFNASSVLLFFEAINLLFSIFPNWNTISSPFCEGQPFPFNFFRPRSRLTLDRRSSFW
jgi:hypothetical protein